jgi:hypothetical protein
LRSVFHSPFPKEREILRFEEARTDGENLLLAGNAGLKRVPSYNKGLPHAFAAKVRNYYQQFTYAV